MTCLVETHVLCSSSIRLKILALFHDPDLTCTVYKMNLYLVSFGSLTMFKYICFVDGSPWRLQGVKQPLRHLFLVSIFSYEIDD